MGFDAPFHTPLEAALDYDFVAETSPGVWRVYGRTSKAEYLAHDITNVFCSTAPSGEVERTEYWELMRPDHEAGFMTAASLILRHENLVSLIDVVQMHATGFGSAPGRERWYAIWDMCDAGTLANLFIPDVSHGPRVKEEEEEEKAKPTGKLTIPPLKKFLPESLVWHVACSLLKGLAWLHDGTTKLEWNAELGAALEMGPLDPDWQPILHRNIAPDNIFFQHPRRAETYGLCKLGNFGDAFVSGHSNALHASLESPVRKMLPPPQGPHNRYVIAPPQGRTYVRVDELRERDWKYRDAYPPMVSGTPYRCIAVF